MITILYVCTQLCWPAGLNEAGSFYREADCYVAGERFIREHGVPFKYYACIPGGWPGGAPR